MANDNTFSINPKNGKKDKRFVYVAEYKKCKQCGIEIIRKRREGRRDWDNRKYCSIDCSIKARVGKKPFEMTDAVREKISKNTKLAMQKDGVINKIKEYLKYNHPTRGKHLSEETKNKIKAQCKNPPIIAIKNSATYPSILTLTKNTFTK